MGRGKEQLQGREQDRPRSVAHMRVYAAQPLVTAGTHAHSRHMHPCGLTVVCHLLIFPKQQHTVGLQGSGMLHKVILCISFAEHDPPTQKFHLSAGLLTVFTAARSVSSCRQIRNVRTDSINQRPS